MVNGIDSSKNDELITILIEATKSKNPEKFLSEILEDPFKTPTRTYQRDDNGDLLSITETRNAYSKETTDTLNIIVDLMKDNNLEIADFLISMSKNKDHEIIDETLISFLERNRTQNSYQQEKIEEQAEEIKDKDDQIKEQAEEIGTLEERIENKDNKIEEQAAEIEILEEQTEEMETLEEQIGNYQKIIKNDEKIAENYKEIIGDLQRKLKLLEEALEGSKKHSRNQSRESELLNETIDKLQEQIEIKNLIIDNISPGTTSNTPPSSGDEIQNTGNRLRASGTTQNEITAIEETSNKAANIATENSANIAATKQSATR